MTRNRSLTELKNIGKKIAARLNEAGIYSEEELRSIGPVEAHKMIRENHPDETLPLCCYLYSFEGALCDKHWDAVGEERKRELKRAIAD